MPTFSRRDTEDGKGGPRCSYTDAAKSFDGDIMSIDVSQYCDADIR